MESCFPVFKIKSSRVIVHKPKAAPSEEELHRLHTVEKEMHFAKIL